METSIFILILLPIVGLGVGIFTIVIFNNLKENRGVNKAQAILKNAEKESDKLKRDAILESKEEAYKIKIETDKEIKEKKNEIKELESKLLHREESIDRRDESLQNRELMLIDKEKNIAKSQKDLDDRKVKLDDVTKEQLELLQKISGFSKKDAREMVMKRVEDEMNKEIASFIKDRENEAKLEVDKKAKNLLVSSMQRYASDVASEQTVTVVNLPTEEMKGRIIGREGRNIRTIEAVTGVDLIIDDTPEAVVLSSFDPLRREIARVTLEGLIKDGRIHPGRIEELYDKTVKEIKNKLIEYGEESLFELGITKVDPKMVELLGKLHFRTSYGQNALQHSKEVGALSGIIATQLGENVALAKRAGLLHDIGKAIDHEIEGNHIEIGFDIAKKYHEDQVVLDGISSHHGDHEAKSVIAVIVAIADALSASRPGARNDSLENYIKRLGQLESIANEIKGVDKAFAVQAGRELRVIVKPEEIDDLTSYKIARDIKERIEKEMQYPGTVKITVIRETRATEEAK